MLNCTHTVGAPSTVTAEGAYLYDDPDSQAVRLYLVADLRERCWEGGHTATAIFAVVFLIFFSLLYPVYALILLTRTFANSQSTGCVRVMVRIFTCCRGAGFKRARKVNSNAHGKVADDAELTEGVAQVATQNQIELYGYLFRGLRPSLYYFRISLYPIQFLYAAMTTFYPGSPLTTFVLGVASAMQTLYIVMYLPFLSWSFNVVSALASLATIGHAMLMLGLVGGSAIVTLLLPLAILCAVIIVLLLSRKQIGRVCEQCRVTLQENEGADSDDEDDEESELEMVAAPRKKLPPALAVDPPSPPSAKPPPSPHRARGSYSQGSDAVVAILRPAVNDAAVDPPELGSPEARSDDRLGSAAPASSPAAAADPPDQHSSRIASPSHGASAVAAASMSPASAVSVTDLVIRAPRDPRI